MIKCGDYYYFIVCLYSVPAALWRKPQWPLVPISLAVLRLHHSALRYGNELFNMIYFVSCIFPYGETTRTYSARKVLQRALWSSGGSLAATSWQPILTCLCVQTAACGWVSVNPRCLVEQRYNIWLQRCNVCIISWCFFLWLNII